MSVNITQEVAINLTANGESTTLDSLQEFIDAARALGVSGDKRLGLTVTKEYSDIRESWPASATITAAK